ncbi:MAG: D-aminoacyl-tRNA deacylase [Clostridia bacterium]|nr:D-aminoacyl-tRNA deacylase [Clostridia bacterium]
MKAILQRVSHAQVNVEEKTVGSIGKGFLILLGVENGDDRIEADVLAAKISGLRIFTDENDKMNLSLSDIDGSVLVISNFTLCADCSHGRRPSFINAARPENAEPLYEYFCQKLLDNGVARVEKGIFGADMKVSLLNDGPVTIDINSKDLKR